MAHPKRDQNPQVRRPKASARAIDLVIEKAWAQGWWVERAKRKNHFKCLSPDEVGIVYLPSTPSDYRGVKNARALLRKYGLKL